MEDPQLENGYTRIANETVEALAKIRISGQEWQVLWVILRKTYGWNKKVDRIALSQFEEMTGIPRKKCFQLLKRLFDRKIIIKGVPQEGDSSIITYGFNKKYRSWASVPYKGYSPPKRRQGVTQKGDEVSPKKGNTKDTLTKDTIQKKYVETSDEVRLSEFLLSKILENQPNFKKPNIQKWAKVIDLAMRIDKRSFTDLETTIEWLFKENTNSDFPFVVQSPGSLRNKFDRIQVQMNRKETPSEADQVRNS